MNQHVSPELLIDYAHGELTAEDDAFVHAHVAACSGCRAELDAEVTFVEALRAQAHREELDFPGALRGAIWAAVETQRPPLVERIAAIFRPALTMPLAAAALALIVIAVPFGHGDTAGTHVDAAYYLEAHAAQQMENPFTDRTGAALEAAMLDNGASSDGGNAAAASTVAESEAGKPAHAAVTIPVADLAASMPETLADASLSSGLDIVR